MVTTMTSLSTKLADLGKAAKPVQVGIIGAGKFGSMYISQSHRTPGVRLAAIADLSSDRALASLKRTGYPEDRFDATASLSVSEAVAAGKTAGFEVVCAGKGTKHLPEYHYSTPDTVWSHYGFTEEQLAGGDFNPQMFNSFLDGTKSALEMAAVANGCGLSPPSDGLGFPPCGVWDLPTVLKPAGEGGRLEKNGTGEVVSCVEKDGRWVFNDLRWGVYVVIKGECSLGHGRRTNPGR